MLCTSINPTADKHMRQKVFKTPIDEGSVRTFLVQMRNFLLTEETDHRFHERNLVVADQDKVVLSAMNPPITPEVQSHEFFVPADRAILRYRERLDEWEALGWRIDADAVARDARKVAYAIPSPARREQPKGWILDPVPLLPASTAAQANIDSSPHGLISHAPTWPGQPRFCRAQRDRLQYPVLRILATLRRRDDPRVFILALHRARIDGLTARLRVLDLAPEQRAVLVRVEQQLVGERRRHTGGFEFVQHDGILGEHQAHARQRVLVVLRLEQEVAAMDEMQLRVMFVDRRVRRDDHHIDRRLHVHLDAYRGRVDADLHLGLAFRTGPPE